MKLYFNGHVCKGLVNLSQSVLTALYVLSLSFKWFIVCFNILLCSKFHFLVHSIHLNPS